MGVRGSYNRDDAETQLAEVRHQTGYTCPECRAKIPSLEEFGPHLERHREIEPPALSKRGYTRSTRCPKGCGRWFKWTQARETSQELKIHELNCDGSPPIRKEDLKKEEPMAKKWKTQYCKEHDYKGDSYFKWYNHKKKFHNGAEPGGSPKPPRAAKAPERPAGVPLSVLKGYDITEVPDHLDGTPLGAAIEDLLKRRTDLYGQVAKLNDGLALMFQQEAPSED